MIRCAILSTILLAVVLSKATIDDERELFLNTIKRWDVKIRDSRDMRERFENLRRAKRSVDRSTSGVVLESLNRFTVNNQAEEAATLERWARQSNTTLVDLLRMENKRMKREVEEEELPAEYDFWEKLGFKPAMNQHGCGSCWAFAAVPVIESIQLYLTGDRPVISEQAIVDCIWGGIDGIHGCAGGNPKDLFVWAKETQSLVSTEAYPYTGLFDKPCDDSKNVPENNAMSKIWLQDWYPTSKHVDGFLGGLLRSPVAFGTYISNDFEHYSGGDWEDVQCVSARNPHAMLLVGYTETTLRVRNSRGADWGENGYVNLLRVDGDGNQAGYLSACKYFDQAYYISATQRRDLEYKYCNDNLRSTRAVCRQSCEEEGWDLAVIPTEYHLNEIINMVNGNFPGLKRDNKFNLLWIGLTKLSTELEDEYYYRWEDGYTPVQFLRTVIGDGKYGLLDKNTGEIILKNNLSYEARGLCSRAKNCWDISKAVPNGIVTLSNTDRSEGTVATVKCNKKCKFGDGEKGKTRTLTCLHGNWDDDLPVCVCKKKKEKKDKKNKNKGRRE